MISRAPSRPSRSVTGVIRPLSGRTKYWPFFDFTIMALREVPTAGINDDKKNRARRIVGRDASEESRAFFDGKGRDLVGDVRDAGVGRDAEKMTALQMATASLAVPKSVMKTIVGRAVSSFASS